MTAVRDDWLRARQRKRAAIAWSSALGVYVLAFAVAMLVSLFAVEELADFSGPIVVRLGSPDGMDVPKPSMEPAPTPAAPEPDTTAPAPESVPAPVPVNTTAPALVPAKPASPKVPKPTPAVTAPVPQPETPPAPVPVVLRGSESGNSYDMTYLSGSGVVSRSLYVPIWLYMRVPNELPASLYEAIPDLPKLPGTKEARKKIFTTWYKEDGGLWQLKNFRQPDYDSRATLWIMLEDAGYDVKNAEYKNGKHLRPVTILFKVSAPGPDGDPVLEAVHIESGSYYSDIDEDVLYGFRKAEFSNSGSSSITGRFTYRF
ncbi:MAG: hypothetical protein A2Y38_11825 [Spirochaetes bacterium GWB1_59_5]|nr:MAG: hypothetical protein A2Y38_11825 [Spirochaetes bacterium GWB1_59_5]